MMSGQFPDEILDPAIRKLGWRFGVVPDRETLRGRLEQEVGFAAYGQYTREQLIEGLRLLSRYGGQIELPDGTVLRSEDLGDLAEHVRRRFPEPGPQSQAPSGLLGASPGSLAALRASTPTAEAPAARPLRAGARAPEQPGRTVDPRLDALTRNDTLSAGSAQHMRPISRSLVVVMAG